MKGKDTSILMAAPLALTTIQGNSLVSVTTALFSVIVLSLTDFLLSLAAGVTPSRRSFWPYRGRITAIDTKSISYALIPDAPNVALDGVAFLPTIRLLLALVHRLGARLASLAVWPMRTLAAVHAHSGIEVLLLCGIHSIALLSIQYITALDRAITA